MIDSAVPRESAVRYIKSFEHKYGEELLHLACHAALSVVINADLVNLIRINFFLDPPKLPFASEADLLLSSLCNDIGDGLYEIAPDIRNVLLQKLVKDYSQEHVREIALLLWQYNERYVPWADRPELERAQQLTALNFLDPLKAKQWLAEAEITIGVAPSVEREWFIAMKNELSRVQGSLAHLQARDDYSETIQIIDEEDTERTVSSFQDPIESQIEYTESFIGKFDPALVNAIKLRKVMLATFDLTEFQLLCAELNVRYEDMDEGPLEVKMLRLIDFCLRQGQYEKLVRRLLTDRPFLGKELQAESLQEQLEEPLSGSFHRESYHSADLQKENLQGYRNVIQGIRNQITPDKDLQGIDETILQVFIRDLRSAASWIGQTRNSNISLIADGLNRIYRLLTKAINQLNVALLILKEIEKVGLTRKFGTDYFECLDECAGYLTEILQEFMSDDMFQSLLEIDSEHHPHTA